MISLTDINGSSFSIGSTTITSHGSNLTGAQFSSQMLSEAYQHAGNASSNTFCAHSGFFEQLLNPECAVSTANTALRQIVFDDGLWLLFGALIIGGLFFIYRRRKKK